MVRWLLDAGVPVDLRDEEQQTALHYAVLAEQEDVRGRRAHGEAITESVDTRER